MATKEDLRMLVKDYIYLIKTKDFQIREYLILQVTAIFAFCTYYISRDKKQNFSILLKIFFT